MINPRELISLIDAVSKEKGLSPENVTSYLEYAMETSLRKEFPETAKIKITINSNTGEIFGNRLFTLVDSIEDVESEMLKNEVENEIVIDGVAYEPFHVELNRQQINITKQVVLQRINMESRNKQFRQLLERGSNIFTGIVKVIKKEQIVADYQGLDIVINRSNLLPRETYKIGDKVTFSIIEEKGSFYGSRTTPQFLVELLKEEVRALQDGSIEIVSCARIPGFRSRIIVKSNEANLNPVSNVVGSRGAHINSVKNQLNGENITVIPFNSNIADMFVHAINPVQILGIVVDENTKKLEVSVNNDDVATAIGKQGKNIASISELLGWEIDVYSSDEWEKHNTNSHDALLAHLTTGLSCDQELAEILIEAGITSIDYFQVMTKESLIDATDLDEETITALTENALETISNPVEYKVVNAYLELVKSDFTSEQISTLIENSVFTTQDLADLSTLDFLDIFPEWDVKDAEKIIVKARKECDETVQA